VILLRRFALAVASGVLALTALTAAVSPAFAVAVATVTGATCSGKAYANLDVGDTISVTFSIRPSTTLSTAISFGSGLAVQSSVDIRAWVADVAQTVNYVLTAKPTGGTLYIAVTTVFNIYAVTCPAVSSSTGGDSANIRSLQINITKNVATTSGQVISNAIDGGINDGFSAGGTPTSIGATGGFINFTAVPKSEIERRTDEAFAALGYAGDKKTVNFNKAPPRLDREWSAWADLRGTGWKINDTSGGNNDLKGSQFNLTAGLGRKLNTDTLVGVVVGYETFKYDVASLGGSLKGDGESIGGYFARRLGGNLRFDAALGWTHANYSAMAGAATGSFTGSRWLASTGLTGTYKYGVYLVEPSAKLFVLWERQTAWTDSLGTAQDARNFSAGRTALGGKVARSFASASAWTLTPSVGVYGDWRFQSDSAIPTGTQVANVGTGWSARVTAGLLATAANGCTVSLDGEYGGLGANYKIWTGNVRATMPF